MAACANSVCGASPFGVPTPWVCADLFWTLRRGSVPTTFWATRRGAFSILHKRLGLTIGMFGPELICAGPAPVLFLDSTRN